MEQECACRTQQCELCKDPNIKWNLMEVITHGNCTVSCGRGGGKGGGVGGAALA